MARWTPQSNQPVGPNEHVGRRLFDEPSLMGARDQKPMARLNLRHFEEKRDGQVSLDRLGRTSFDKAIVRYLKPRADKAGAKFSSPKVFHGWAVLTARKFASPPAPTGYALSVIASPENGNDLDENIYHAHVADQQRDYYGMALHLRELFETYGTIERVAEQATLVKRENRFLRFLPAWLRQWLIGRVALL